VSRPKATFTVAGVFIKMNDHVLETSQREMERFAL
jgi:hypothetical protein